MRKPEPGEAASILLADGQKYSLRYPLRTLKELKTQYGLDVLRGGAQLSTMLDDPAMLAIVLAAGLRSDRPDVTPEWVEDNVDASMMLDIAPMLVYAATGQWIDLTTVTTSGPNGVASNGSGQLPTGSASGPKDAMTSDSPTLNSGS